MFSKSYIKFSSRTDNLGSISLLFHKNYDVIRHQNCVGEIVTLLGHNICFC